MEIKIYQGLNLLFATNNVNAINVKLKIAGEVTVLPNHIPLVGEIQPCEIVVHTSNRKQLFKVSSGLFYFAGNHIKIITQSLTNA